MLMWLGVLGIRTDELRSPMQHAHIERDALHAIAYADPLTGLPNRRSLNEKLVRVAAECGPGRIVALNLLDLGGHEFLVVTTGLPGDAEARRLGQKLLSVFREPFVVGGQDCSVGATIGYASTPLDGVDPQSLLKRADAAMYVGKHAGRNCLERGAASAGLAGA
ncbi:MAG: GGDEF domain-containing protein [Rhodocyclaceae bacterium]